jgi:hypothetical protein
MTIPSSPRLLEVTVTAEKPTLWKWKIFQGDLEVARGFAVSRESAQIEGDTALLKLLTELKP